MRRVAIVSALVSAGIALSVPQAFAYPPEETTTTLENVAPTPPSTNPSGTVPRTGSDSTGIVQFAGVTLGAGVMLAAAAGVRRRRSGSAA